MPTLLMPISALLAGVVLLLLGNGLLNTLLTLRGSAEGYSAGMLGLAMSGYFLGFFLGSWVAAPLIRGVGHIRAFAFCAALAASCALLHLLLIDIYVWLLLRVVYGVALVCLYTVIESWLNAQTASEKRGTVFAIYMVVNLGALALAQQLLHLGSPSGYALFIIAALFICWALMPLALTRQAQPTVPESPRSNLRELFYIAPLPVVAAFLSGLALGAFWGMAPVYAAKLGYDEGGVGLLMGLTICGGAVLQWPIGRFSDRHDRRQVLTWVAGLSVCVALVAALLPASPWLLGVMFLWGGLSFALYPIAVAQLIDQLRAEEILAGSSGLLVLNGIGSAIAPLLVGVLMQHLGPVALPLYFAVVLGGLLAYCLYRRRRVSELIAETPGHFVPMVRTSSTVLELMPDAPAQEDGVAASEDKAPA